MTTWLYFNSRKILTFFLVIAGFSLITQLSIANAADIERMVKVAKQLVRENRAGQDFLKRDYLAYNGERTYVGAVANVKVEVRLNKNNKISRSEVTISEDVHLNMMPFMEKLYGAFTGTAEKGRDQAISSMKAYASSKNIRLREPYDAAYYYYKKGKLSAKLGYNGLVLTTSGDTFDQPETTCTTYLDE